MKYLFSVPGLFHFLTVRKEENFYFYFSNDYDYIFWIFLLKPANMIFWQEMTTLARHLPYSNLNIPEKTMLRLHLLFKFLSDTIIVNNYLPI